MDNTYYTPDITEFHVGFEYEEFVKGEGWVKRVHCFGEDITLNKNGFCIDFPDDYRVKYLDAEDIISLGFEEYSTNYFKKNTWAIEVGYPNIKREKIEIYLGYDCRFKGTIKNKSELKKLLTQLQAI